jgi:hypothetical protein
MINSKKYSNLNYTKQRLQIAPFYHPKVSSLFNEQEKQKYEQLLNNGEVILFDYSGQAPPPNYRIIKSLQYIDHYPINIMIHGKIKPCL